MKGYKFFLKSKTIKLQKKDNQLQTLNLILKQINKKTFNQELFNANLKTIKTLDEIKYKFN